MSSALRPRVLRLACLLALVGLALMSWSIVDPRPVPVIVAMSVGQGAGTLSFLAFLVVAFSDIRWALARRLGDSLRPPPKSGSSPAPRSG
jgi:hypothetical protein